MIIILKGDEGAAVGSPFIPLLFAWAIGVSLIIRLLSQSVNITIEKPVNETNLLPKERVIINNE